MTPGEATPAPAGKCDPESLVLRSRPPRAIRFRRGIIIGIAALGSVSLIGITWAALKPRLLTAVTRESELSTPSRQASADTLASLPDSYGDVPKLGPPLPGDLGRPILRAERQQEDGTANAPTRDGQDAADRQGRLDAVAAARRSPLLVQTDVRSDAVPGAAMPIGDSAAVAAEPDRRGENIPHRIAAASSPFILSAGSVIAASLITGLQSDLAGIAIAQVTADVYDSATGRILLVPQGSRLIGRYESGLSFGQSRLQIAWQRLILPDASSLRLDDMPATDAAGRAGLTDQVDRHMAALVGAAGIATLLSVGNEAALGGEGRLLDALRQGSQQGVMRAGDQLVSKQIEVRPTLRIRPGAPVRLLVERDLILAPWIAEGER
nr:TrbI/VirB10 family protein [Sphingomonas sp. Y57]